MTREEEIIKASQMYASYQQKPFLDGARWADKTMIDKACEWLEVNVPNYFGHSEVYPYLKDFRKAMEE